MPDQFTETTTQSWLSRIRNAFKGIIAGLIFFIIAFPLLFWNEGRTVKRMRALEEGGGLVVDISADTVNPDNEGKLVHLTGKADTDARLSDDVFGVTVPALKLKRVVEMYQWKESRQKKREKKIGGKVKTTTTYTYEKVWSSRLISSSGFRKPENHENPKKMKYSGLALSAEEVRVGAFRLPPSLIEKINTFVQVQVDGDTLPEALKSDVIPYNGGYYAGGNPESPGIGDLRITFQAVYPTMVSIIARQVRDTFEPFPTKSGDSIELLEPGTHSAASMFQAAQESNRMLSWLLRFVGFVLMFLGLVLMLSPLSVFADVLPLLGSIVGAGTTLIAFLLSAALSLLVISIAWIAYRPLLAVILLAITGGAIFLAYGKLRKAGKAA